MFLISKALGISFPKLYVSHLQSSMYLIYKALGISEYSRYLLFSLVSSINTSIWLSFCCCCFFNARTSNSVYANNAQIHSWNQPVLCNEGKCSCCRKHWEPLLKLELKALYKTHQLWVRSTIHCAMTLYLRKTYMINGGFNQVADQHRLYVGLLRETSGTLLTGSYHTRHGSCVWNIRTHV